MFCIRHRNKRNVFRGNSKPVSCWTKARVFCCTERLAEKTCHVFVATEDTYFVARGGLSSLATTRCLLMQQWTCYLFQWKARLLFPTCDMAWGMFSRRSLTRLDSPWAEFGMAWEASLTEMFSPSHGMEHSWFKWQKKTRFLPSHLVAHPPTHFLTLRVPSNTFQLFSASCVLGTIFVKVNG